MFNMTGVRGRPRKYPEGTEFSNVQFTKDNIDRIAALGTMKQTYNDIIDVLLTFYEDNHKTKK